VIPRDTCGPFQSPFAISQIKTLAAKSERTPIPISVTHTDLPTNDWITLFQTVLFSRDSYLAGENNVFCFASGMSVYRQIFPANHIAFGYSAITEHWLSRKPCNIPNGIWSPRATGKVRDTWAAQAKADWRVFLQYRALEMRPSARLLIVASGADAQGNSGAEGLTDLANHVLQQVGQRWYAIPGRVRRNGDSDLLSHRKGVERAVYFRFRLCSEVSPVARSF